MSIQGESPVHVLRKKPSYADRGTLSVSYATISSDYLFFFFSSRRRHTRFDCDWSSDVCSSDLHCKTLFEFHGAARTRDNCVEELAWNLKKGLTMRTGGLLVHTRKRLTRIRTNFCAFQEKHPYFGSNPA